MASFLSRYLDGEHEQVWAELLALGEQVREEPLYSDALAVAHETMRRVRYNIELLIPRLKAIGYHFYRYGVDIYRDFTPEGSEEAHREMPIFAPPTEDVDDLIKAIEHRGGILPLSLKAFYRVVGTVNLGGTHPNWGNCNRLDSLEVHSAKLGLLGCDQYGIEDETTRRYSVPIAPDEFLKGGAGGAGPYTIPLGIVIADAPLEGEWHETTFVNYLRICFRWGGMPGLERCLQPPMKDIANLIEDFLPI